MNVAQRLAIAARIAITIPPRRMDAFNKALVKRIQKHSQKAREIDRKVSRLTEPDLLDEIYTRMDESRIPSGEALANGLKMIITDLNDQARKWMDARREFPGGDTHTPALTYSERLDDVRGTLNDGRDRWSIPDEISLFGKRVGWIELRSDFNVKWLNDDYGKDQVDAAMAIQDYIQLRDDLVADLAEAHKRMQTMWDREYKSFDPDKMPASTQKVETLYHASVDAAKLYRDGFAKAVPGGGGLGGSQSAGGLTKGTSFTYDLRIALAISRGLKIGIAIANGKTRLHHVLEWARRDGILDEVLGEYGKGKTPKDNPYDVFWLYKAYTKIADFRKAQHDPLFFGDIRGIVDSLKGKNARNVGVVVAEIDTTHPDIKFVSGREREVRVPPEAVIRTVKLIK